MDICPALSISSYFVVEYLVLLCTINKYQSRPINMGDVSMFILIKKVIELLKKKNILLCLGSGTFDNVLFVEK